MNEVTVQLVARTRALRAPCGEKNWVFSLCEVKMTSQSEKTHHLWQRQARSAGAMSLLQIGLKAYRNSLISQIRCCFWCEG
ncbi:MAG: hypothetical protein IT327_30490 [Anaerolineae bacterium]|nr:hypothetical protein [Anaerolineae bacterium]